MENLNRSIGSHVSSYAEEEVNRILGGLKGDATFLATPTTIDVKRSFEYESKRLINMELHLTTLGEYYRSKRIPRGMRSRLRPSVYTESVDFKRRFEEISDRYALDIILLNLDHLQSELTAVQARVLDLEQSLPKMLSGDEFSAYMDSNRERLDKFRNEVMDTKKRKWYRDQMDYTKGRVYTWNQQWLNNVDNQFSSPRRGKSNKSLPRNVTNNSAPSKDFLVAGPSVNNSTRNPPEEVVEKDIGQGKTRRQKQGKLTPALFQDNKRKT
ncbi:uncharacterized protein LOC130275636 [Hyla sarda]|uniref:uncharacterized protein LOC130275636 n=1 Tax=Hyla sarda TaxID=327740 RepID=UPI0024C36C1F|nr:uncharacterized protein LOC130275636 [Hyla sarda]